MPEGLSQLPPYQDPAEIERQRQEAARRQAMLQILSPPPAAGFPQAPTQGMAAPAPIPMPGPPPPPPFPRRPFAGPTVVRPGVTIDQSAPPPDLMPQTTAYQQALAEPPMLPTPIPWYKKLGAAGLAAAGGLMPRFAGAAAMGTNELTRPANEQQMLEQAARLKTRGQAAEAEQGAIGAKSQAELRAAQANEANATAAFRAQPPTDNFGSSSAGVFDKRTGKVVAPAPLQPGAAPPRMVTIPPRVRLELWPNDPSAPTELPDTLIAQLVNATKPPASPTPSAPIAGRDFPLNPDVEKQRARMSNASRAPTLGGAPGSSPTDPKDIAKAIMGVPGYGNQPPVMTGLYRNAAPVKAELARAGYDLSKATLDWTGTVRHMQTLNGPQQMRVRQALETLDSTIPLIKQRYAEWQQTGLPGGYADYNKMALMVAAKLPGSNGASARALLQLVNDAIPELGYIYMGGNSPTDHTLQLAATNLSAAWNQAQFATALQNIEETLKYRRNSIANSDPSGIRQDTPYWQMPGQVAPASSTATAPGVKNSGPAPPQSSGVRTGRATIISGPGIGR